MAVTNKMYGPAIQAMVSGDIDLTADTIKVALFNNSHTFTQAHDTWSDISANEVTGDGYTEGGATLTHTGDEVTYLTRVTTFGANADDTEWADSTITAYYAVVYKYIDDEGSPDATSPLICCINFDGAQSSAAGTFKITWNASGIFTITVAE